MTTHDHHTEFDRTPEQTREPAPPRQGDNVLDPSIAQGDWTAETQDLREPTHLQPDSVADVRREQDFQREQDFSREQDVSRDQDVSPERDVHDHREQVAPPTDATTDSTLIAEDQLTGLRARWDHVQASFVDDPRECVQKADGLVTDVVDQLTNSFAQARSGLEAQWARGEDASTEDLRVALRRYRDFFDRLLAV